MTGRDRVVERVRLAAYAWAEDDARLLLVRLAPTEAGAGLWMLPGGGLDFGEDPADGVLRELTEETGLVGAVEELLAVRSRVAEPGETRSGHRIHAIAVLYRVSIIGGELRDETDESTDRAAWIPLDDLEGLPSTPLLHWARARMAP
ncbi:MAG TPA: NUDIX domain-containing protein [Candidatus Limnocylindrales bacterium]|nr:NUDIX domain-containing protein [Candidatus Limnocylindrales bacterium]